MFKHLFGYKIDPILGGALIAGGAKLLGGFISGRGADKDAKERARLERELNLLNIKSREKIASRTAGQAGIGFLAQERSRATKESRRRSFRSALISSAGAA